MITVPGTLAACLQAEVLASLEAALGPPMSLRARGRVELELEVAGEGTFTVTMDAGVVSAKKGFARDPLISASIGKGGFSLVQRLLQGAMEGFPRAPALARVVEASRAPRAGDLDAVVASLARLKDACVRLEVKGAGTYAVARGPVDEATQVLTISLDAAALEGALGGAPLSSVRLDLKGDRGVLTAALAALAPLVDRMRATAR